MNGKLQVHGHCNGLKTTHLFALMWGVIMLLWWATGASQSTLGYYILIGLGSKFLSHTFNLAFWFYFPNLIMVATDICLYFRNKKYEAQQAAAK